MNAPLAYAACRTPVPAECRRIWTLFLFAVSLGLMAVFASGSAFAQSSNQILSVSPTSAAQGTSNLLVTFNLDTDSPPAPPSAVGPSSVTLGTMSGSSATHVSQYVVTAVFSISYGEAVGTKDATITFSTPNGTLTFSKSAAFTVTAGGNVGPTITQQPSSRTAYTGTSTTFTVVASGTPALRYQWQKDDEDISLAQSASYTIGTVALSDSGNYRCVVTNDYGTATSSEALLTVEDPPTNNYPVVDTGQAACYNATSTMTCPSTGEAFYGQDSQCQGHQPSFTINSGAWTVHDNVTGLTWQRSPDTSGDGIITATDKLTWAQAQARPAVLNAANYGGFSDWRLPTIKELYSLIDFRGTDPSGYSGSDTSLLTPFIDKSVFRFAYGQTSAGERIIDSQYASSNLYLCPDLMGEGGKLFGVNFADGRIKGYGLVLGGSSKTFFVQCVRGNTEYGINNFRDNGDLTVTDLATNLTWTKGDNGAALDWTGALAYVQTQNAASYLGHGDWRLPNAKELQSILDYTRAPDATDVSRQGPACDPVFTCSAITNENCVTDYPWYWTGTTHAAYNGSGYAGIYVCFGRAMGYMSGWADVHGAGAQRSDPKAGSLSSYTHSGCGYYNSIAPQGDAIRITNYVRLVRDADTVSSDPDQGSLRLRNPLEIRKNPCRGALSVRLSLVRDMPGDLSVYDAGGRHVATIERGLLPRGERTLNWNGAMAGGRIAPAGAYFLRLLARDAAQTVRFVWMK